MSTATAELVKPDGKPVDKHDPKQPGRIRKAYNWLRGKQTPKPEKITDTFDKRAFTSGVSTSEGMDRHGKFQEEKQDSKARFSEELRGDYEWFIGDYMKRLAVLKEREDPNNPGQTLFDTAMADTLFSGDRELFEELVKETQVDARGKKLYDVDQAKLQRFLATDKGWAITTQLMDRMIPLQAAALALEVEMSPPSLSPELAEAWRKKGGINATPLNMGRGSLHRKFHDEAWPYLTENIYDVQGRPDPRIQSNWIKRHASRLNSFAFSYGLSTGVGLGAAAAVNYLFPGFGGTLLSAGPLLVNGVSVGAGWLTQIGFNVARSITTPGLEVVTSQSRQAVITLQKNPEAARFMAAMTGINVDQIDTTTPNIRWKSPPGVDIVKRERDLKRMVEAREEFYRKAGADKTRIDSHPFRRLLHRTSGLQQEQTDSLWSEEVQANFRPERDIKDIWGQTMDSPWFCRAKAPATYVAGRPLPPGTPNARPEELDHAGNFRRAMEAQSKVLGKWVEDYVDITLSAGKDYTVEEMAKLDALEARYDEAGDNSLIAKKREGIRNKKDTLERNKALLDSDVTALQLRPTRQKELEDARKKLQNDLKKIFTTGTITTVNDAYNELLKLNKTGETIMFRNRNIKAIPDQDKEIEDEFRRAKAAWATGNQKDPMVREAWENAQSKHTTDKGNLEKLANEIEAAITQLQTAEETIETKTNALDERDPEMKNSASTFDSLDASFREINKWGISEVDLATKSYDVLLKQINDLAQAGGPGGWLEASNAREDLRLKLERAMVEARMREDEGSDATIKDRRIAFDELRNIGVTEQELRTLTRDEINKRVNTFKRMGGAGWEPTSNGGNARKVDKAIAEAQDRFNTRVELRIRKLGQRSAEIDDITKDLEIQMQAKGSSENKGKIKAVKQIYKENDRIKGAMREVQKYWQAYTDTTIVPPKGSTDPLAAKFKDVELELRAPVGYYKIMDAIFDYQLRDDREPYFKTISAMVPPERLAQVLNDRLKLGASPVNITEVLKKLGNVLDKGTVGANNLRSEVIVPLRRELYEERFAEAA